MANSGDSDHNKRTKMTVHGSPEFECVIVQMVCSVEISQEGSADNGLGNEQLS